MKPGVYEKLTNEEYHSFDPNNPTISNSCLMDFIKNKNTWADKYIYQVDLPKEDEAEIQDRMEGNYLHEILLEDKVPDWAYVMPDDIKQRRGKEYEKHLELAGDKFTFKRADVDRLELIKETILKRPNIAKMLSLGRKEVSAYAVHPETGLTIKARADILVETSDYIMLLDLKCVGYSVMADHLSKVGIGELKRHYQAYFHRNVFQLATKKPVMEITHLCINRKKSPYDWNAMKISSNFMAEAEANIENGLRSLKQFMDEGNYFHVYEYMEVPWMNDNTSSLLELH